MQNIFELIYCELSVCFVENVLNLLINRKQNVLL